MPPLVTPKTPHRASHEFNATTPSYFGLVVDHPSPNHTAAGGDPRSIPYYAPTADNHSSKSGSHAASPHNDPRSAAQPRASHSNDPASSMDVTNLRHSLNAKTSRRKSQHRSSVENAPTTPKTLSPRDPLAKSASVGGAELSDRPTSPKRMLSQDSSGYLTDRRTKSPANLNSNGPPRSLGSPPLKNEDKHLSLSLPDTGARHVSSIKHHRADTVPTSLEPTAPAFATSQHVLNVIDSSSDEVLLLDLRVSTHYARSRIVGALNLCIPTTLLKRPSYNVGKLADTFKDEDQKAKFEEWKSSKYLIVYDNSSTQLKEANNCVNILKKFASEGWNGDSCIIKGGFSDFADKFPKYVDHQSPNNASRGGPSLSIEAQCTDMPPVMGGCPIPATKNSANPFFGNIRQNMDLIGGVGQMRVQLPPHMSKQSRYDLPRWLQKASDEHDNGKTVSEKFFNIEKKEQRRMQEALSGRETTMTPPCETSKKFQIAGIEKGDKNRYNNIWPYEHSRVKLKDVSRDGCDYVNANFVKTSLSNRSYIATQGPIPSTFGDFWNMIWQRDIRVIVMLTAETEGGQVKAHNYWDKRSYGQVKLNFHSETKAALEPSKSHRRPSRPELVTRRSSHLDQLGSSNGTQNSGNGQSSSSNEPHVIIRNFTMSHSRYPFEQMREVTQIQYSNWPDFGAPAHPAHLLGLVEQCNGIMQSVPPHKANGLASRSERPILVHCSAGCGRTGTFCTVDTVVDVLKRQRQRQARMRHTSPMDIDSEGDHTGRPPSWGHKSNMHSPPPESPLMSPRGRSRIESELRYLDDDDLDLIEKVVGEFRLQRLSMVQSLRQFVLCYETVLEWIVEQEQPKTA